MEKTQAPTLPMQQISMPQIPLRDLAAHALEMFSKLQITGDEASIVVAVQLRGLLQGIASGQLLVGRPAPEKTDA
jgi:hypothetical protein